MKLVGAALGAALLLAGCAGSGPDPQDNPKDALISAFENLSEREGHEITVSLDATADSLRALGGSQPGTPDLSDEDAEKILASSLHLMTKGKGEDAQMELVVTIAGEEDVTVKVIEQNLYFQADAEGLAETFDADPAELEAAASQAEAQGLDFVRPALEGEWIAVTGFQELQEQMGGPPPEEAAKQQEQFMKDMTEAIRETSDVEHVADEDTGDHLVVTLPIRDLYTRLMDALKSSLGPAGGFSPFPQPAQVPNESVVLDVWVEDDSITQVALDLNQITAIANGEASEADSQAALLIELDEFDDEVEAPEDVVEVEAQQLFQIFGGMMMQGAGGEMGGHMGGSGSSGEFDCSQLEGAPPAVLKQFADTCPELQNQ